MLALKMAREMEARLHQAFGATEEDPMATTLQEVLEALRRLCFYKNEIQGVPLLNLPRPDERQTAILKALSVSYPVHTNRRVGSREK